VQFEQLKKDPHIVDWLNSLDPAPGTEIAYLQCMQWYARFCGMTPTQLLAEAEDEADDGVKMRNRKIKSRLIGFRKQMRDSGLADFTIRGRMTGVKSFYQSFDVQIPNIQSDRHKPRTKKENMAVPVKQDIQDTLKICDPLARAIILVGVSSGLASNEIRNLKIGEFKKGYDPETEITTLDLRRRKVGFDFITFLSPEASRAIWDYLSYRDRKPKNNTSQQLRKLTKQRVVGDDGYLFILRSIPDEYLDNPNEELRKLNENALLKMFQVLSEKAQKNNKAGCYNLIRSHNMRKYFNSAMLNAGADSFFVEYCMGHTLDDTRGAYFIPDLEKLREIYQKFIPYLTIQKELVVADSPEFQHLQEKYQNLEAEAAMATVERSEILELRAELERMKKFEAEFSKQIVPLKERFEAIEAWRAIPPITLPEDQAEVDALVEISIANHLKKMQTDPEYKKKFNVGFGSRSVEEYNLSYEDE
jgi:integrase